MTRSKTLVRVISGCAVLAPTAVAFAADESGANPQLLVKPETAVPAMIAAILMFLVLFFLLKKSAWGLILNALNEREVKIRTEIESAENARAQAQAALEEYEKELAKARAEAGEMIASARQSAEKVADELRAKNEAEIVAMKERAKQDIEAAKRAAITDLYNETARLSTTIAEKILEREISAADHEKLVDDSLQQLASMKNGGRN
ncbi:MAG: F0F1 ATP synthase subunit B [Phycisphaerales bacterium]